MTMVVDYSGPRCPSCQQLDTQRSRRQGMENIWGRLFLEPWRCRHCGTRFWCGDPKSALVFVAIVGIGVAILLVAVGSI